MNCKITYSSYLVRKTRHSSAAVDFINILQIYFSTPLCVMTTRRSSILLVVSGVIASLFVTSIFLEPQNVDSRILSNVKIKPKKKGLIAAVINTPKVIILHLFIFGI